MMRALLRKCLADLRAYPFQSLLIVAIVACCTAALTLALTVRQSTNQPFERVFAETNGAHLWIDAPRTFDLAAVAKSPEVAESAGPYPTLWKQWLVQGLDKYETVLYAMPATSLSVGQPAVTNGRWLGANGDREVVLDRNFARDLGISVGQPVELLTKQGKVTLHVVGLAVSAGWGAYPDWDPGMAYVLPQTLPLIDPNQADWTSRLAVRLRHPDSSEAFSRRLEAANPRVDFGFVDWHDVRDNVAFNANINVATIGVMSLFALIAACFVVANAIGGRVLAQVRDIGLLKAIGFTPGQVTAGFLLEYLALGLAGGLLGAAGGIALAPLLLERSAEALHTTAAPAVDGLVILLSLGIVLGFVALFTLLPAWKGGRIATVAAIGGGVGRRGERPSRLARFATYLHFPPALVVGIKDAFARPLRSWVAIAALALTVVYVVDALGGVAMTQKLLHDPTGTHNQAAMSVNRGDLSDAGARQILAAHSQIQAVMPELQTAAALPGSSAEFDIRAVSGDIARFRPPIYQGRMFAAPGEAVAGQGLLDLLGVKIGDSLTITVNDKPLTVKIVGRILELDNDGRVISTSFDTLHRALPTTQPDDYVLALAPKTDKAALKAALVHESKDQFQVTIISTAKFRQDVRQAQALILGLNVILLVVGLANLLSITLLGVRERFRDLGVLKAIGGTPQQIVASVLTGVGTLTLIALLIGIPVGLAFNSLMMAYLGKASGFGREIGANPPLWSIIALVPGMFLFAALAAALPGRFASHLRVVEAVRYE
ncbi:MAG TPA: FtsX-like permease family protein [Thermomicrobiales bacterium]|nr:FtsX-like permease family protein [Thermomicrobiales bacterium]